ncbi:MAG: hypothetical protein WBW13_23310, partial [Pseudolabrys sp.]
VKDTSVCIVDDTGRIVHEVKVPSEVALDMSAFDPKRTLTVTWLRRGVPKKTRPYVVVATA